MPDLDISPEKVAWVITKAREFDAKVQPFNQDQRTTDENDGAILEERRNDTTGRELASFIGTLNDDEQANLVALTWIGRETFGADEWQTALTTARDEHVNQTAGYLMGIPLLADYLEAGLEAMGYRAADYEKDFS